MTIPLRFAGPIAALDTAARAALLDRSTSRDREIRERTAELVEDVRERGDAALRDQARAFDRVELGSLEVPRSLMSQALRELEPSLRSALERAAKNISRVHAAFVPTMCEVEVEAGVIVGRRPDPLGVVGVYAPGGRAAYPSSLLMGVIPARVAGVEHVVACSPPERTGVPSRVVMAAAAVANVDRLFAIGGAGAVAAMAFGTETVPRVDRIVGPGNAFVAEAKLQLSGSVAIDSPAGPSELLVIADEAADARAVAREMVAQAEHDPRACSVAVVLGEETADRVISALRDTARSAARADVVAQSLASNGAVVVVDSIEQAIAFAGDYAPEHLLLATREPERLAKRVRNAGTIFIGLTASVAFGDYMTGANHVLPTGGLARCYSGLSTHDFVRWTTYQRVSREAAAALALDVSAFATAEGLPGHADAALHAGGQR